MKSFYCILFICVLAQPVFAQHKTNPDTIYQPCDIYIQNTDLYYFPFAPPAPTDTRAQLSAMASELRNPDGVRTNIDYTPVTHDTELLYWKPWGVPIGANAVWMRLFTAMNKPDGSPSDIVLGDSITTDTAAHGYGIDTVRANEDVDLRATGTIKFESGVHILPGAEFHAYIAPTWDTTVFSDEFDSTPLTSQWVVTNGYGGDATIDLPNASFPANAVDTLDTDAFDGHALRMSLTEDTCNCDFAYNNNFISSDCTNSIDSAHHGTYLFKTAALLSCPWPFIHDSGIVKPAYQNAPYGKYEVRLKTPSVMHHLNNYGDGQSNEFNLGEAYGGDITHLYPGPTHRFRYGPFTGIFSHDTLRCSSANFAPWNPPTHIIINNFLYEDEFQIDTTVIPPDTFLIATGTTSAEGGFPSSVTSGGSVTFYYTRYGVNAVSDLLPWSVDSAGTYFTGGYAIVHGYTQHFTKSYQPTAIGLPTRVGGRITTLFFNCHWNHLDTSRILLTQPIGDTTAHSGIGFQYQTEEGPACPVPAMIIDTIGEKYHTYTMEILPHEARLLVDGAVLRRWPDRLIPPGDQRYDYMTYYPRAPMNFRVGELDVDDATFSMGKADFESKYGVNGTAYQWIDYAKIWDLPPGTKISQFPH